jgi:hypothetical protein
MLGPLQEVVDQLRAGVAHLDVERFHAAREVVVHPHRRNRDEPKPIAVATSASAIPPATAPRPVDFSAAMPRNALMMPTTVPNRPTKGAVEPMVARLDTPRFNSECTMAWARSRARLDASISSPGISALIWCARNSCKPGDHDFRQDGSSCSGRRSSRLHPACLRATRRPPPERKPALLRAPL